ncbi:PQQ-dependent sugar dehydrogenase [Pradoshia sp. D12]|uniref:PQQ-dependent sugar dehydrogenase n=1 Tax=Bacillaceae TaxID=186817 RepID=UPI0011261183|nr:MULTISPECIES: PQQ-dependent sugar dehydrogenase [Bacillaceae]QFK70247.1 PQQ-dependent sugar dehydrogenase [Pradoshia sp. D12]TPF71027.1 PQQ-dependent sugar dehydrogenase [Bacillus sp. D12]
MKKIFRLLPPFLIMMALLGCSKEEKNDTVVKQTETDEKQPYEIEVVAEGLNVPWEMVIADDGRIFFTERPGQIREIRNGKVREEPLLSLPAPFISEGEGGLLGLALDPEFQTNHFMYTYHSYEDNGEIKNRILRLVVGDNQARIDKVILDGIVGDTNHNGGRIMIGPDGMLYITAGDRYEPDLAQDKTSMGGKIFRIHLDGSIPDDNPIEGSPVYSYGHRNPQGLAWHLVTGDLFSSEHGQSAHDEINLIEAGKNYGWPIIQGDEAKEGMETPIAHSATETWAPSGMTFVSKGEWKNQLLIANLRGVQVLKVELDESGKQVKSIESLFKDQYGRIRNIIEAPDGTLYMMTNNRDGRGNPSDKDDRIIRLIPKTGI